VKESAPNVNPLPLLQGNNIIGPLFIINTTCVQPTLPTASSASATDVAMTPGSSPRSSGRDRHLPSANIEGDDRDDDDLNWPELKRPDDAGRGGSRLDKPIIWGKDLKSEEEVYLDDLRTSCKKIFLHE
jgi:hypothetical protein